MARLADLDPGMRTFITHMPCPRIDINAWCTGPALNNRRVALISTAGLRRARDSHSTVCLLPPGRSARATRAKRACGAGAREARAACIGGEALAQPISNEAARAQRRAGRRVLGLLRL